MKTRALNDPATHQPSGPALGAGERLVYEIPHAVAKPAGVPLQPEQ